MNTAAAQHTEADADPIVGRDQLLAALDAAADYYRDQLAASWVPDYLAKRGLGAAARYRWRTGYAPQHWTGLIDHLRILGHTTAAIQAAGLAKKAATGRLIDTFRDRLMLPVRDLDGHVITFLGRLPDGAPAEAGPRWKNGPETLVYRKSETLYGLYEALPALKGGATIVIVEGGPDVIAVTESAKGAAVAVATCGTALTAAHINLIETHAQGAIATGFDPDTGGQKAEDRGWPMLHARGIDPIRAEFPGNGDPADTLRDYGADALTDAIIHNARPLVEAILNRAIEPWVGSLDECPARIAAMRAASLVLAQLDLDQAARYAAELSLQMALSPELATEFPQMIVTAQTRLLHPAQWPTRETEDPAHGHDEDGHPGSP